MSEESEMAERLISDAYLIVQEHKLQQAVSGLRGCLRSDYSYGMAYVILISEFMETVSRKHSPLVEAFINDLERLIGKFKEKKTEIKIE